MPTTIITYNRAEFDEANGESVPAIDGTDDDIYRNGARWNRRYNAWVAPLDEPDELREAEEVFLFTKMRRMKERYNAIRRSIVQDLSYVDKGLAVGPPDDDDFEALKSLAERIAGVESELSKLKRRRERGTLADAIARMKEREKRKTVADARVRLSELPRFDG